jgi:hypothetical protein
MVARRWRGIGWLLVLGVVAAAAALARAQGGAVLRVALVPQWVLDQHRAGAAGSRGALVPAFRSALDAGVVDRVVFWWQRGAIQRQLLVRKPVRVLAGPEAEALGGRGEFRLGAVRSPGGPSAWTEVEVVPQTDRPTDVAILEIGGELGTIRQVVQTILVTTPDGALVELPLSVRPWRPGEVSPVVRTPLPASRCAASSSRAPEASRSWWSSPVEVIVGGRVAQRPGGRRGIGQRLGDWREGTGCSSASRWPSSGTAPALVLGWKDRQLQPDPTAPSSPAASSSRSRSPPTPTVGRWPR